MVLRQKEIQGFQFTLESEKVFKLNLNQIPELITMLIYAKFYYKQEINMSCCGVCGGQKTEQTNEQDKDKNKEQTQAQESNQTQAQKANQTQEQDKK